MAKTTAWLITIIGLLMLLGFFTDALADYNAWLIPVLWLVVGITKLVRNYKK